MSTRKISVKFENLADWVKTSKKINERANENNNKRINTKKKN